MSTVEGQHDIGSNGNTFGPKAELSEVEVHPIVARLADEKFNKRSASFGGGKGYESFARNRQEALQRIQTLLNRDHIVIGAAITITEELEEKLSDHISTRMSELERKGGRIDIDAIHDNGMHELERQANARTRSANQ